MTPLASAKGAGPSFGTAPALSRARPSARAVVYIDGFNLYYGALKRTPHRWLDVEALCACLLPGDIVHRIRYFTARVRARPDDPGKALRQQVYLRALATLPSVTVHFGHFLTHRVRMPLAPPPASASTPQAVQFAWVWRTEEKGSDVNLATHLLHDAFCNEYDLAVVISNDSDLAEPIRIVRRKLEKKVGIFAPYRQHPSRELEKQATFFKALRQAPIAASQFPNTLRDARGPFHRPSAW